MSTRFFFFTLVILCLETATALPKIEDLSITDNATAEENHQEPVEEQQAEVKDVSSVSEDENIKDAWDETSDEEESEKTETIAKKEDKSATVSKPSKKAAESESESEETESSEDESESEEDSYSSSDSEDDGKVDQTERIKLRIQVRSD